MLNVFQHLPRRRGNQAALAARTKAVHQSLAVGWMLKHVQHDARGFADLFAAGRCEGSDMPDEVEIARKLPVWSALAELFLDTELDDMDRGRIAKVIRVSGFSPTDAERMLRDEVLPAFASNLFSVAGEWSGWAEDDVRLRVVAAYGYRGPWYWLVRWRLWPSIRRDWQKIAALM